MADALAGLSPIEIVDKIATTSLSAHDQKVLLDYVEGLISAGTLPSSILSATPTWADVVAWLKDGTVDFGPKSIVANAARVASAAGLIDSFNVTPDFHPPNAPGGFGDILDWVRRATRGYFEEVYNAEINEAKMTAGAALTHEETRAIIVNAAVDAITEVIKKLSDYVTAGTPIAGELSAHVMNQIAGLQLDEKAIGKDFTGVMTDKGMKDIGAQFGKLLEKIFPADASVINNRDRADRDFAVDNLHRYFGTNMNFQMRSLAIGSLASIVPFFNLRHFEGLHQSINWAYGFGWLSWTVLSAIMGVTTTKPLTEYYNAKIKGNDLTEQQALHAVTQKRLGAPELTKVLNNHGIRDDIRHILLDQAYTEMRAEHANKAFIEGKISAAEYNRVLDSHGVRDEVRQAWQDADRPDLSEGDIDIGYENGLFSEQDVKDNLKKKGFDGFNLQAKVDLTKDRRLFALRRRLEETYFHGYVLGTVPQAEFTNYLASISYTQLEVDMELKRAEIIARSHLQKHLTRGEIIHLVGDGSMSATDGLSRLVAQGLPDGDARRLLADSVLRHAVSLVPTKVRQACLTGHEEANLLGAAIQVVTELDPTYVLQNKDFVNQAQCILNNYLHPPPATGGTTPTPGAPPAPQGLTAGLTATGVDLQWQPVNALVDYVVYRRDIGSSAFIPLNLGSQATTYTDTGITRPQTYFYVVRSKANGVESADSNEVQVFAA